MIEGVFLISLLFQSIWCTVTKNYVLNGTSASIEEEFELKIPVQLFSTSEDTMVFLEVSNLPTTLQFIQEANLSKVGEVDFSVMYDDPVRSRSVYVEDDVATVIWTKQMDGFTNRYFIRIDISDAYSPNVINSAGAGCYSCLFNVDPYDYSRMYFSLDWHGFRVFDKTSYPTLSTLYDIDNGYTIQLTVENSTGFMIQNTLLQYYDFRNLSQVEKIGELSTSGQGDNRYISGEGRNTFSVFSVFPELKIYGTPSLEDCGLHEIIVHARTLEKRSNGTLEETTNETSFYLNISHPDSYYVEAVGRCFWKGVCGGVSYDDSNVCNGNGYCNLDVCVCFDDDPELYDPENYCDLMPENCTEWYGYIAELDPSDSCNFAGLQWYVYVGLGVVAGIIFILFLFSNLFIFLMVVFLIILFCFSSSLSLAVFLLGCSGVCWCGCCCCCGAPLIRCLLGRRKKRKKKMSGIGVKKDENDEQGRYYEKVVRMEKEKCIADGTSEDSDTCVDFDITEASGLVPKCQKSNDDDADKPEIINMPSGFNTRIQFV